MALPRKLVLWTEGIRHTLVLLLPLILIGALANAARFLPLPLYRSTMDTLFGTGWPQAAGVLIQATNGITGLASAMVVAARVSLLLDDKERRHFPLLAAATLIAAGTFLLGVSPLEGFQTHDLGYASLFTGLLLGVFTAEALSALEWAFPAPRHAIDYQIGDTLQFGIRMSLFGAVTMLVAWLLSAAVHETWRAVSDWGAPIGQALAQLQGVGHGLGDALLHLVLIGLNQLLWLVGLNGGQLILEWSAQGSTWIAPPGADLSHPFANPMWTNAFGHLGGAGATWGLILAILLRGRDPVLRRLAWASVLPALINVNELLLFGIPLVFGLRWLPAFLAAPMVGSLVASLVLGLAQLPDTHTLVTWSTPVLLSGYLLTDSWLGPLAQAIGLSVSTLIYWPVVGRLERRRQREFQSMLQDALTFLCTPVRDNEGLLERSDHHGRIARALIKEFEADLGTERVYLVYQPVQDAQGRVLGVEALLRWQHAEYGAIPPPAVINPAEECALIHRVGTWVVNRACQDMAVWQRHGHADVKVAVNVSPVQLDEPGWPDAVAAALALHRVRPQDLKLEVTEGRALTATEQSERNLARFQAMNVPLCMDDFGMGCTSLLYLQRIRLSAIKLDGCLTRDIERNPVNQDIVRTVARLGHSQGVHVVAEYVETSSQQALLAELGCDQFQGWLYAPGLRLPELLAHLDARRTAAREAGGNARNTPLPSV